MTIINKPVERKSTGKPYLGKLQKTTSRLPANPPVNYAKGGSDFRCPQNTSALGKQVLSAEHLKTAGTIRFPKAPRFTPSDTIGVGPAATGQFSSLKRQQLSSRNSAGSVSFGTSSRDDAWKLYAIYTAKRF
jgi:hypothetical protein